MTPILSEEALAPDALTSAYEAYRAHAADPGRKGSGIEKAIRAYLAAAPQTPMVGAEPMEAWTWQLALNSHGLSGPHFSAEKPVFSPSDAAMVRNLRPLYASPPVGAEPMEAVAWRYRDAWGKWAYCQALDNLNGPTVNTEKQALYTASPLDRASVTVNALEWQEHDGAWSAETPFGLYDVSRYGKYWAVYFDCNLICEPGGPDPAKAAAQADYDARIRSALKASP